jgi:biopolymer transport protein TolR
MLPSHTRSVRLYCKIDATALAAVLFVLAVIMIVADSQPHHGYGPDLPHVSHAITIAGANRDDVMMISIMRDGMIFFGMDKLSPSQLPSKIQDRLKDRSVERKVYIRADRRVWYGTVKEVLDGVGSAGIERVAFLVDERRPPYRGTPGNGFPIAHKNSAWLPTRRSVEWVYGPVAKILREQIGRMRR